MKWWAETHAPESGHTWQAETCGPDTKESKWDEGCEKGPETQSSFPVTRSKSVKEQECQDRRNRISFKMRSCFKVEGPADPRDTGGHAGLVP